MDNIAIEIINKILVRLNKLEEQCEVQQPEQIQVHTLRLKCILEAIKLAEEYMKIVSGGVILRHVKHDTELITDAKDDLIDILETR